MSGYQVNTNGNVALSAATARTVLGFKSGAQFGLRLRKVRLGFSGVTSTNTPATIQISNATFATNSPGTASTSFTPLQVYGFGIAVSGISGAHSWTVEPTVLTAVDDFLVPTYSGSSAYDYSVGESPVCAPGEGFVLIATAAQAVNIRATMVFERV